MTSEDPVSRDERERVENARLEYEQLSEHWRHNETVGWAVGAILTPVSAGSFALMFQAETFRARFSLGFVSIVLLLGWVLVHERLALITRARQSRANELEQFLGMRHHQAVAAAIAPPKGMRARIHWLFSTPPHRYVWRSFLFLLIAAVGWHIFTAPTCVEHMPDCGRSDTVDENDAGA